MKDLQDIGRWSPAVGVAVEHGLQDAKVKFTAHAVCVALTDDYYDPMIPRTQALELLNRCTTPEARIVLAKLLCSAFDVSERRRKAGLFDDLPEGDIFA
jgi:hypothetical protein